MRSDSSRHIEKILISGYTGLGHFILKTVLINKINETFPNSEIVIIAGNNFGTEFVVPQYRTFILHQNCNIFQKFNFFWKLRREKIDVVFLPFDASPVFLILGTIIAGIPIRIGNVFNHSKVPSYFFTHPVPVKKQSVRNEIDLNLDLLQAICEHNLNRTYIPVISPCKDYQLLNKYTLVPGKYICIQIAAANGGITNKLWLEENFRELIIKLLNDFHHIKIVLLGDKGDSKRVNRVCNRISSDNLLNLSGKTSLQDVKCLINDCKFLVCHDSGLLHMGNALGKNLIALYGYSEPDAYAKQMPSCQIIQKQCDCPSPRPGLFPGMFEPTEEEFAKKCPIPECMRRITVNEVLKKCRELLLN